MVNGQYLSQQKISTRPPRLPPPPTLACYALVVWWDGVRRLIETLGRKRGKKKGGLAAASASSAGNICRYAAGYAFPHSCPSESCNCANALYAMVLHLERTAPTEARRREQMHDKKHYMTGHSSTLGRQDAPEAGPTKQHNTTMSHRTAPLSIASTKRSPNADWRL